MAPRRKKDPSESEYKSSWVDRILTQEGSTRGVALIRIGLAILLWVRFGYEFVFFKLGDWGLLPVALSFFGSTTCMLLGLFSRVSTAWTAVTLVYCYYHLGFQCQWETFTQHNAYLLVICTCLLVPTPSGGSYSIDRWLAIRRARTEGRAPPPERGELWAVPLLAAQVSAIYLWGAFSKLDVGYLSGERLVQVYMELYHTSDYPSFAGSEPILCVSAVGSVFLEVLLAFGLWVRRWHWWLMPAGVAFHALLYLTMLVRTFSATMWLLYLAYIPPDALHRFIDEMSGVDGSAGQRP